MFQLGYKLGSSTIDVYIVYCLLFRSAVFVVIVVCVVLVGFVALQSRQCIPFTRLCYMYQLRIPTISFKFLTIIETFSYVCAVFNGAYTYTRVSVVYYRYIYLFYLCMYIIFGLTHQFDE